MDCFYTGVYSVCFFALSLGCGVVCRAREGLCAFADKMLLRMLLVACTCCAAFYATMLALLCARTFALSLLPYHSRYLIL